jgi:hypothetical protein
MIVNLPLIKTSAKPDAIGLQTLALSHYAVKPGTYPRSCCWHFPFNETNLLEKKR